jgi:predicted AAA+ superfamily ATPase
LDSGLRKIAGLQFSPDWGKLAENLVGKLLLERGEGEVYYWKNKHEIDFVVRKSRGIEAINVCYTNRLAGRETEGLLEFKKKHRSETKLIVITKDIKEEKGDIQLIPLWRWLLNRERAGSASAKDFA